MSVLTLRRPDDWHLHLRDGAALASVLKFTAERFGRAIVMPNLKPPVATTAAATAYQKRVLAALPKASTFAPLMTLYLTDSTLPEEIDRAIAARCVHGVKLYPAGATTHSDAGVTDIGKTYAVLERMAGVRHAAARARRSGARRSRRVRPRDRCSSTRRSRRCSSASLA